MKNFMRLIGAAVVVFCATTLILGQNSYREIQELKLVAQLPPELPQRVMGLAFDGENLWATIYLGKGRYARLNPVTLEWSSDDKQANEAITNVAPRFASPGGVCFDKSRLWVVGAYGESFGSIKTDAWKVDKFFQLKQLENVQGGQSYSSVACTGTNLWIVWHWYRCDLRTAETQLLLKVDPETGNVIAKYAAPGGTKNDGVAGLTWDGASLWYMKDDRLSSIDPTTGTEIARYLLPGLRRPSGLAWVDGVLWISEFDGKIWRVTFAA